MHLPLQLNLPVNRLTACFNNTSATYKFYWFLSIIQSIENGQTGIDKRELFAKMVANAWYTVNYFQVSFGKQDKLQEAIREIKIAEQLPIDANADFILATLIRTTNIQTVKLLRHFNKQVPHRFLGPWFPQQQESVVYSASQQFANDSLYALYDEKIIINPNWIDYLTNNAGILKDFCYWNLALYLQAKNPNVPDIPNKLVKPALRNSLTRQRKQYWDIVLEELTSVKCIYTSKALSVGKYAVEHFIPYSFVSHDLIWNLIPADPGFNSAKNNKLPQLDKYFDAFFRLQQQAIEIVSRKAPSNKFLEDYLTIFPDLKGIAAQDEGFIKEKFMQTLQPLVTIAVNNGFQYLP